MKKKVKEAFQKKTEDAKKEITKKRFLEICLVPV